MELDCDLPGGLRWALLSVSSRVLSPQTQMTASLCFSDDGRHQSDSLCCRMVIARLVFPGSRPVLWLSSSIGYRKRGREEWWPSGGLMVRDPREPAASCCSHPGPHLISLMCDQYHLKKDKKDIAVEVCVDWIFMCWNRYIHNADVESKVLKKWKQWTVREQPWGLRLQKLTFPVSLSPGACWDRLQLWCDNECE